MVTHLATMQSYKFTAHLQNALIKWSHKFKQKTVQFYAGEQN